MDNSSAYRLRARDGEFAMLWSQAFALGEERLREGCIAAALGQVSTGDNPGSERAAVETGPFNADLAIKLLSLGNRTGVARRTRSHTLPSQKEVDAALIARFAIIDQRKARLAGNGGEQREPEPDGDGAA